MFQSKETKHPHIRLISSAKTIKPFAPKTPSNMSLMLEMSEKPKTGGIVATLWPFAVTTSCGAGMN